jgi:uncharacterized LabA/DUF88 family protein
MRNEPAIIRAVAFIDGQNLFHSAKQAFGYNFPNYNVRKLAEHICELNNWHLTAVRFYTGIPDEADKPFWHHFWAAKGAQMGRDGVKVFTRALRYRTKKVRLPDGSEFPFLDGDEKGIDVRISLDIIRMALKQEFDIALLFSRDQDMSEVADEIRIISQEQGRWIKIASAYPFSPALRFRGIDKTDWIKIDRAMYDRCLDPRDYRPKKT